jgi:hypothetical protein
VLSCVDQHTLLCHEPRVNVRSEQSLTHHPFLFDEVLGDDDDGAVRERLGGCVAILLVCGDKESMQPAGSCMQSSHALPVAAHSCAAPCTSISADHHPD